MKVWRIKFHKSKDYSVDVVSENIIDACILAVNFHAKQKINLQSENIISAELISLPINEGKEK